ncbi:peptide ABC transporter substrate-binding protein [bacterium SCSIO 12696]|nr:peptide ABC transporter substrate-binding protein [bacterium SCSIO 12696]
MRDKKSTFRQAITPLLTLLLLAACSDSQQEATKHEASENPIKKQLVIGINQYPSTLHRAFWRMTADHYALSPLVRRPVIYDDNMQLVCRTCVTLPTLENGLAKLEQTPDGKPGMAVTFQIQPDARWGDGSPLVADDFKLRWEMGRNPKVGAKRPSDFAPIYQFDIVDNKTFVLHLDKVFFSYNYIKEMMPVPAHLERPIFEENPLEYRNNSLYVTEPLNPGLWHGPYLLEEITFGNQLVMTKNPYWNGTQPQFEKITLRAIENTSALEANLLSGTIDVVAGEAGGFQVDQGLSFEKRHGHKHRVVYTLGVLYEAMPLNHSNPILADKRVRKALMYAFDREQLNQQIFGGKQPPAHGLAIRYNQKVSEQVTRYDYDKDRAIALLEAAGWSDIKNGIRHNAQGEPLRLSLNSISGNKTREMIQQALQAQLKDVGIDLRISNETARSFLGETLVKRKFSGLAQLGVPNMADTPYHNFLNSQSIGSSDNGFQGGNWGGFNNPEMNRLTDMYDREIDAEKRQVLVEQINQLYTDELPHLPLYWRPRVDVLPLELTGFRASGHFVVSTNWIEEWRWE